MAERPDNDPPELEPDEPEYGGSDPARGGISGFDPPAEPEAEPDESDEHAAEMRADLVARQGPVRTLERPDPVPLPAAVAAATGGFLLGVASFVLVRILRRPKPARIRLGRRGRRGPQLDVAGTRSFLVDIHLLDRR